MIFEQKKNIFITSLKEFLDVTVELTFNDQKKFFWDVQCFLAHVEFGEVDHFLQHDRFLSVSFLFIGFCFCTQEIHQNKKEASMV